MLSGSFNGSSQSSRSPLLKPFYPALDGLRAIAILLVLALHFGIKAWPVPGLSWGWVGVDIFLVLSGFLITGILFDSLSRPDFFRNFYIRRALRIFPLYYSFWLLLLLLTPLFHFQWNVYVVGMMAYVGNLFTGSATAPGASTVLGYRSLLHPGQQNAIFVGHFWSLCVEEQFYLVWPAVVFLLRSRKALLRVCLAAIVLAPLLRTFILYRYPQSLTDNLLYDNTFVRVDTLLIGAALALWLRGPTPEPATLRNWSRVLAVAAPVLLGFQSLRSPAHGFYSYTRPVVATVGYTLIGLASAAILVLAICPGSIPYRLLRCKPLASIGRVSYGMYVLHAPLIDPLAAQLPRLRQVHMAFASPVLGFVITFVLAKLSFRYLESPFLLLKERFAARPGVVTDPPPATVRPHRERSPVPDPSTLGAS